MKNLLFTLSFSLLVLFSSCTPSTDDKANRLFSDVFKYMQEKSDVKIDLKHHKIIYSAPNDSLSVIEFTSSVAGIGTETMYFAYVVEDNDEDYWVMLMNNPVDNAKSFSNSLKSILGTSDNENDDDEKLLYSTIRLNCSMKYHSGGGHKVKDTETNLKKEDMQPAAQPAAPEI